MEVLISNLFKEKPIAFYPCLREITGSITGAILLQHILSLGGECRQTREEILQQTRLSRYEQEGAIKKLQARKLIEVKTEGCPPRRVITLNPQVLNGLLIIYAKSSSGGNSTNQQGEIPPVKVNTGVSDVVIEESNINSRPNGGNSASQSGEIPPDGVNTDVPDGKNRVIHNDFSENPADFKERKEKEKEKRNKKEKEKEKKERKEKEFKEKEKFKNSKISKIETKSANQMQQTIFETNDLPPKQQTDFKGGEAPTPETTPAPPPPPQSDLARDFHKMIDYFNKKTGKRFSYYPTASYNFQQCLKLGYTLEDIFLAIDNLAADKEFCRKYPFSVNPEYITRVEKLEMWRNVAPKKQEDPDYVWIDGRKYPRRKKDDDTITPADLGVI